MTTILEGESLLNDATSLVTLRTALAAAGLAVAHGEGAATHPEPVGPADVAQSFAVAVVGGVAVGVVVFLLVGWLRRRVHESAADTALSFVAPFAAYLPAEEIGASGVLAVVTAGLLLAHKAPLLQTASSRLSERINWASDPSPKGLKQSYGLMVNYLYDLKRLDKHRELLSQCKIPVAPAISELFF